MYGIRRVRILYSVCIEACDHHTNTEMETLPKSDRDGMSKSERKRRIEWERTMKWSIRTHIDQKSTVSVEFVVATRKISTDTFKPTICGTHKIELSWTACEWKEAECLQISLIKLSASNNIKMAFFCSGGSRSWTMKMLSSIWGLVLKLLSMLLKINETRAK